MLFCNKYQTQAIPLCMMLGKRLILQMWKADYVPTFEMWARELGNMLHLEELRFILKDKLSIFHLGTNKKILTGGLNKFYVSHFL